MAFVEGFKKFMGMSPLDEEDEFFDEDMYGEYSSEDAFKIDDSTHLVDSKPTAAPDIEYNEYKETTSSMEDMNLNTMNGLGYDTYSGLNDRIFSATQPSMMTSSEPKNEQKNATLDIHKVVMFKPVNFDDASDIAVALLAKNTVIINTESIDNDLRRRIVDFISGVAYADNADIKKASNTTFVITPSNVILEGEGMADEEYNVRNMNNDGEIYY